MGWPPPPPRSCRRSRPSLRSARSSWRSLGRHSPRLRPTPPRRRRPRPPRSGRRRRQRRRWRHVPRKRRSFRRHWRRRSSVCRN
ncbi:hypothetical protein BU14_0527s0011 [Porphyra umbilicalis]|uniref:Uncharacterized protein n=1 Tax=Porphyra umbilicalis TaxID=2786 RepID=A0A1X6NSD5_PORUM|nr:hypothetical protein BU14_0527s0011 [Porphyra umbilicalis]|eukprot:OSX71498.1 hypothetical protein BU14_0527s0011 [Porphyra umbilicalis]